VNDENGAVNNGDRSMSMSLHPDDLLADQLWAFDDFEVVEERPKADIAAGFTSLPYISAALRRLAWVWCAAAIIGVLGGAVFYKEFPPAYQASTSILMTNNPDQDPVSAMATDVELAESRTVAQLAMNSLGIKGSAGTFQKGYTATGTTGQLLVIAAKAPSSAEAVSRASAVAAAFLQFRTNQLQVQQQAVLAGLGQQIAQAQQRMAALDTQITAITSAPDAAAHQNKLNTLRNERTQAETSLSVLEQTTSDSQATTQVTTQTMVKGTGVLDAAAPVAHSRLKLVLLYVGGGLVAGLVIGLAIVIIRALVSDRLRRRDDIAAALGAPVKLSVGRIRIGRWLPRRRGMAPARTREVKRIAGYLGGVLSSASPGNAATLAVVPVDNVPVVAVSVASLALSLAREGKRVIVADLADGAPAVRLLGAKGPGVRSVNVDGASLVVSVPDRDSIVPVGPLERVPRLGMPEVGKSMASAFAAADVLLTVAPLDPSLESEHLATWAKDAVIVVTAGRSSSTRIHAVGELIRFAGTSIVSAVLVGADKTDESLGVTPAREPAATADSGLGAGGQ
jgi:capsular polysaccharide biosynthesis protein